MNISMSTLGDHEAKVISIGLLIGVTLFFGFVPIVLLNRNILTSNKSKRRKLVLDLLNCFSGGVFLGASLLHLFAGGLEDFEKYKIMVNFNSDFPFYEVGTAVGLFLVALVEKTVLAFTWFSKDDPSENVGSSSIGKSISSGQNRQNVKEERNVKTQLLPSEKKSEKLATYGAVSSLHRTLQHDHPTRIAKQLSSDALTVPATQHADHDQNQSESDAGDGDVMRKAVPMPTDKTELNYTENNIAQTLYYRNSRRSKETASMEFLRNSKLSPQSLRRSYSAPAVESNRKGVVCDLINDHNLLGVSGFPASIYHQTCHASLSSGKEDDNVSPLRTFLLLIALSFHSVFDGLAVGLQDTDSEVWQILASIVVHKSLVAFCLGLEMAEGSEANRKRVKPFLLMCVFSLVSPIGIGIGMGVKTAYVNEQVKLLMSCVLQSIATGTFLYVTFYEILAPHISHRGHNTQGQSQWVEFTKIFVTILGFSAMAAVKLLD